MSVFTAEITQQIVETCRANVAAIAESLNSNFAASVEATVGELLNGADAAADRIGDAAGVAVTFKFGDEGAVCLIPDSLPIPDWYRNPSEEQTNQLQAIGTGWSTGLFPLDLKSTEVGAVATQSLRQQLETLAPAEDASVLELQLTSSGSNHPDCTLLLIWPLSNPVLESVAPWPDPGSIASTAAASPAVSAEVAQSTPEVTQAGAGSAVTLAEKQSRGRVFKFPVELTVRIASKKVDVSQLRNISQGTLITFNKPCESLLDVFVGEKLKFRGEAVKVGESFGIKINEANAQVVREQRVHRI